ncbi:MAG: archaeal heat shock protein Hsp20 [Methanobacteriota archaeon]
MNKKRRHGDEERDPFGIDGFEDQFEEMREYMSRLVEQMASGEAGTEESGPFVYGFSMRMGPDGKPVMQKFGDTRELAQTRHERSERLEENPGEREPLTDVIEDSKTISITVEIPGVEKKDIDLSVVGQILKIKVDSAERRYFKEVQLPTHVDPNSTKATYNNGVLDITLCKSGHGPEKKIRIE